MKRPTELFVALRSLVRSKLCLAHSGEQVGFDPMDSFCQYMLGLIEFENAIKRMHSGSADASTEASSK